MNLQTQGFLVRLLVYLTRRNIHIKPTVTLKTRLIRENSLNPSTKKILSYRHANTYCSCRLQEYGRSHMYGKDQWRGVPEVEMKKYCISGSSF